MQQAKNLLNGSMKELESLSSEAAEICEKCNTPKSIKMMLADKERILPVACKCRQEELKLKEQGQEAAEKQRKLDKYKRNSLMDEDFMMWSFENWKYFEGADKKMYDMGKRYVEQWEQMKKDNKGILLTGEKGVGKSYLSGCIANELFNKGVPTIAISSIAILETIKESFRKNGEEGELDMIRTFKNADLLVIDDLGAENRTEWSIKTLYSVLDGRYRSKKPTIITTNLTLKQLEEHLTGNDEVSRTYDRIISMCVPVTYSGTSKRIKESITKSKEFIREMF